VAVAEPFDGEPGQHGGCRSCQRVDPDKAGLLNCCGGAGVEAEPAEPQDSCAEHHEGDVVGAVVRVLAESLAVANNEHQDQAGNTGVDVHHCAACEVNDRSECLAKPAVLGEQSPAPDHECQRRVHQGGPDWGENYPGRELRSVCDRTGDQCHGDDGEGCGVADLEQIRRISEVVQPEVAERVCEDLVEVIFIACGHGRTPQHPHDADSSHCHEAHHHHVQSRLGARHAAVEECQARGHEQHEC